MLPDFEALFDRPVIILAAPRSGSTLLFETLARVKNLWTIGGEGHQFIEGIRSLSPVHGAVDSNRLTAEQATPHVCDSIRRRFARFLRDRDGKEFFRHRDLERLRFLEKTPKNALRQPFLDKVFPGALYIYLYREPRSNISSMMEAWKAGRWVTYPRLRGWRGPKWSLLLPPDWLTVSGRPLQEVCAFQWESANRIILDDLEAIDDGRWAAVSYQAMIDDPETEIERLCAFADLDLDGRLRETLSKPLPLSRYTHTRPDSEKWRRNEAEILSVYDSVREVEDRALAAVARKSPLPS
jgi:hypothetical protein